METNFSIIYLLIFALVSWRKVEHGICLVVFTLPCYLLRLKILGIPTTVLELEIYVLLAIWLIKKFQVSSFKFQVKNIKSLFIVYCPLSIAIALILSGAILSTIFSSDLRTSAGILKGWFFDPLIFSFIVLNALKIKEQIKNLLFWFAASGTVVAIMGLFYYFMGRLTFDGRLGAFYLSPNHLAMYLAPCFLAIFYLMVAASGKAAKYLWIFGLFSTALALYLTYSYSTWLGVLAGLIFFNFIFLRAKMKIWGGVGLIILIIFLFCLQLNSPKLQNLIESPRSSFQSRIMVWQSAILMIKNNPIFGIGPGMFQEYYLNYQKYFSPYLEWAVPQPHNLFLAFLLQTGLIGFTGLIWLLVRFFRSGFTRIATRINADTALILMSVMVYTLIHGLLDTTYWKNDLSVIFWLIISLMIIVEAKNTPKKQRQ